MLKKNKYDQPPKADVWALGATAFAAVTGRFPLIDQGEVVPRVSNPLERADFERELARRAEDEWDLRVDLALLPPELQGVMGPMLKRSPDERVSTRELIQLIEASLPAFLRGAAEKVAREGRFSPIEEIGQIRAYIDSIPTDAPIPTHKKSRLRERLEELGNTKGLSVENSDTIKALLMSRPLSQGAR